MRPSCAAASIGVALTIVSTVYGQRPPDYTVKILAYFDAETLATFARQVQAYADLRASLEPGLPPLRVTAIADEIDQAENALGSRIRRARATARVGDIFTPRIQRQIQKMLSVEADKGTLASLFDDNPGAFRFTVNATYPKHKPVSTVPPNLLQLLPPLPDGMEYRFVGRDLILRDMKANIIVDEVAHAIRCEHCEIFERP
jgi:hypothetical protein